MGAVTAVKADLWDCSAGYDPEMRLGGRHKKYLLRWSLGREGHGLALLPNAQVYFDFKSRERRWGADGKQT